MSALDPRREAALARLRERAKAPAASDPSTVRLRTVGELFALGVRFISLNGKIPRPGIAGWNRPDYGHTLEQAEQWAREGNVGIVCGHLIVLDIDKLTPGVEALLASLPDTVRARTGKGSHIYFLVPEGVTLGNSTGALPKGIDVRGAGGYVVAPGSIHPDTGRPYAWEAGCAPWEIAFAPLPESVLALIKAPKVRASRDSHPLIEKLVTPDEALKKDAALTPEQRERARRIALGGLKKKSERVRSTLPGTSQNTYYEAVCDLFNHHAGGLVTDDEADEFLTALDEAAEERGVEGIDATRASGMRMGNSKPRYAHQIIAETDAEEADADRFVAGLTRTREVAEASERLHAAVNDAIREHSPRPLLQLRREWGLLALHDSPAIATLRTMVKPHKDDLGGFKLGDLDVFLKEVKAEAADQESAAEVERLGQQGERPMIAAFGDPRDMIDASREALVAWGARGSVPVLFMRSGGPVMVGSDGRIAPVGREELGFLLAQAARHYRKSDDGSVRIVEAPFALLNSLGASIAFAGRLPDLDAVSRSPIVTPNGKLLEHGYDGETKTLVVKSVKLSTPADPTREDARAATAFLLEHIIGKSPRSGFPCADEASTANALALFLTPALRPAINGPVPMAVIDAPAQSTGKTLLATTAMLVATGSCDTAHLPFDDRELQRDVLAPAFNEARLVLILDNLVREVDSPLLAKVLTDREFAFRAYHTQAEVRGPNRLFLIATGNNVQLGTDLVRRSFKIQLDARTPNPDGRTGFRHSDLHHWVREHRADVLSALFTIARAWYVAGEPEATVPTLGSYREWSRIVGGMLAFAGVRGFLTNLERSKAADRSGEEIEEFLRFLAEQGFAGRTFTARDVCGLGFSPAESLSSHFRPQDIGDPRAVARRLGIVLLQVEGRRYGTDADCLWIGRAIDEQGRLLKDSRNTTLWTLHREHLGD